jgi:hypothetical protein
MRYVLSTFSYDPIAWLERYGWRPLTGHERTAAFHFYREIGQRMGIADIPADFTEFQRFKESYGAVHFTYSDTNHQVGLYTMDLFCGWFPRPLRPLARLGVRSQLEPAVLAAFGFAPAPAWVSAAGRASLRARALAVRWLWPARQVSKLAVQPRNRTYPGYPRDTGQPTWALSRGRPTSTPDGSATDARCGAVLRLFAVMGGAWVVRGWCVGGAGWLAPPGGRAAASACTQVWGRSLAAAAKMALARVSLMVGLPAYSTVDSRVPLRIMTPTRMTTRPPSPFAVTL